MLRSGYFLVFTEALLGAIYEHNDTGRQGQYVSYDASQGLT